VGGGNGPAAALGKREEAAAGCRRREHGWVHKLRLVFYEAEKIKRFDWLIYPSRLLLSSIFERAIGWDQLFCQRPRKF